MKVLPVFELTTEACQSGEDGNLCQNQADARLAECIVTCGLGFDIATLAFEIFYSKVFFSKPQKG